MLDDFGLRLGVCRTAPAASDDALERWIGHSLRRAFDGVLAEPMPKELLCLLGEAAPECAPLHPSWKFDRVQNADCVL